MVSVCMTTYNGELYLEEQIKSILSNIGPEDELIVSDDGSTDSTIDIINNFKDNRIKLIHHSKSSHYKFRFSYTTTNFSNAIKYATGDYIFLSDQDDVWEKDKVKKMLPLLEEYDLVVSDCSEVDSCLNILYESHFDLVNANTNVLRNIYKCSFLGCCMCFNKDLLNKIMPIPEDVPHDLWIGCVASLFGKIKLLEDKTLLYRRHDKNVSITNSKILKQSTSDSAAKLNTAKNSSCYMLSYRFVFIKRLIRRYLKLI